MDILPRSNLPPYIEGSPTGKTRKRPLHKPCYIRRVKRAIQRRREARACLKNSSNASSAAAYLHLQQEQRRSRRTLQAERLHYEWKLANSAKLAPPKNFRSCKPQQANGSQNPASSSSRRLPCNHRPKYGRPSQTDISRFLS